VGRGGRRDAIERVEQRLDAVELVLHLLELVEVEQAGVDGGLIGRGGHVESGGVHGRPRYRVPSGALGNVRRVTMLRLFLIAAVLVSPWGIVTLRRVLAERRARTAARSEAPSAEAGTAPEGEGTDVAVALAAVRDEVASHAPGEQFVVDLPTGVTLGGRPAERALVARLVADDLRRSGVEVVDPGDGTSLRCRRA
jgi:hypothetical protein